MNVMTKKPFIATRYKNKPAIYDKDTGVYYYGYETIKKAREHAKTLNEEMQNKQTGELYEEYFKDIKHYEQI